MYYNKILKISVIDLVDYFFISALISSLITVQLKDYYSEKASMERLKNSIIKKSRALPTPTLQNKKLRVQKIYRLATFIRGGQRGYDLALLEQLFFQ